MSNQIHKSAIDTYVDELLLKGGKGVRVIVSKGSVNNWHAYIQIMGFGGEQKIETNRHPSFFDALMELEELLAERLEKEKSK